MTNKEYITEFKNLIKQLDDLRIEYGEANKLFLINDYIQNKCDKDKNIIFKICSIQFYAPLFEFAINNKIALPDIKYYCEKINLKTGAIKTVFLPNKDISNYTKVSQKEINIYKKKLYQERCFYVLINDIGHLKFGISKNVKNRIKALKSASGLDLKILKIVKNKPELESYFKNKFKEFRLNGEWFKDSIGIREELNKY